MVPIAALATGDTVWAHNARTGLVEARRVLATFTTVRDRLVRVRAGDETLVCSDNHRFHSRGAWTEVRELRESTTAGGSISLHVEPVFGTGRVHNINVDEHHSYFVGRARMLVHNAKAQQI